MWFQMIFLDASTAKVILHAIKSDKRKIEVSLDLGRTRQRIDVDDYPWDVDSLQKIAKDTDSIYFIRDDGIFKAAIRAEHFYKLLPSESGKAPALLIDGVLMHRVKEMDPMEDARLKSELCAYQGFPMLEICTGLGYSCIQCLKRGIKSIITIEKDPHVIELSRINPWSSELFIDERVELLEGDASVIIHEFDNEMFDSILLDPPRWPWASELYTSEFYSELLRTLRPKGILYHYVGTPGAKYRKQDIAKGVMTRLRDIGFKNVKRVQSVSGVLAKKS